MPRDDVISEAPDRIQIPARREELQGADTDVARRDAGQYRAGQRRPAPIIDLPAFLPPRKSQNIRDWPAQRCVRCYPQAYEDDAERAVRAGLELVAAVSGLKHTHHYTLVSALRQVWWLSAILIGSGASQEQAIVGETPNLAARLQASGITFEHAAYLVMLSPKTAW